MKKLEEKTKDAEYPMRINKYLAHKGYSTRRGGDELISKKMVTINSKIAVLGDKVKEKDVVEVKQKGKTKKYHYFAYNKPLGTSTPNSGNNNNDGAIHSISIGSTHVFPVGRLDKDSCGLMILTDDGRITDRLLNPDYAHEKEYVVAVRNNLRPSFKMHMEAGVDIGDYVTKRCKVEILGNASFKITLTEGKKHQIRRMCTALHNDVTDLKRIRIMNIRLGKLASGQTRTIDGPELETFLKDIGL